MSFLGNLVSEFTGHHKNQEQPPQAPPPWVARWDDSASRWIFVNEQTGERTHNYPQQGNGGGYNGGYAPQGGYGQQSGYPPQSGYPQQSGYPPQGGYGQPAGYGYPQGGGYGGQQGGYPQEEPKKKSNALGYGVAAVAGIAGGALLVHEGEKVHEHYEEDKYRLENKVADGVQDVEDFPEDAAQWTGRKVRTAPLSFSVSSVHCSVSCAKTYIVHAICFPDWVDLLLPVTSASPDVT